MKQYKRLIKALISPNVMVDSVLDINLEDYYTKGFRQIFLDIDNTVVGLTEATCNLDIEHWINTAKKVGFQVFIVSNNISWIRIYKVAKQMNLSGYYFAAKPLTFTGDFIHQKHQLDHQKTLVVGDQVLTDVIFGNWMGSYSILVDPIERKSNKIKKAQYKLENSLLKWVGLK